MFLHSRPFAALLQISRLASVAEKHQVASCLAAPFGQHTRASGKRVSLMLPSILHWLIGNIKKEMNMRGADFSVSQFLVRKSRILSILASLGIVGTDYVWT